MELDRLGDSTPGPSFTIILNITLSHRSVKDAGSRLHSKVKSQTPIPDIVFAATPLSK